MFAGDVPAVMEWVVDLVARKGLDRESSPIRPPAGPAAREFMGLFDKFKQGLAKTKELPSDEELFGDVMNQLD